MRRPFQSLHMLNLGTSLFQQTQAFTWFISFLFSCFLSSPLTATRANHDGRSCLLARVWNLPQLHSLKRGALAFVNWWPLFFVKYNFCLSFYYWHARTNNNRLGVSTPFKSFDRLGVKNCLRCQHRTDYFRGFRVFCPNPDNLSSVIAALTAFLYLTCDWQTYF